MSAAKYVFGKRVDPLLAIILGIASYSYYKAKQDTVSPRPLASSVGAHAGE